MASGPSPQLKQLRGLEWGRLGGQWATLGRDRMLCTPDYAPASSLAPAWSPGSPAAQSSSAGSGGISGLETPPLGGRGEPQCTSRRSETGQGQGQGSSDGPSCLPSHAGIAARGTSCLGTSWRPQPPKPRVEKACAPQLLQPVALAPRPCPLTANLSGPASSCLGPTMEAS